MGDETVENYLLAGGRMDHTESDDSIISGFVSNLDHILKNKSGFRW